MPTTAPLSRPSATEPVLLREDQDSIATLTMNRGAQRNPLSREMLTALTEEIHALGKEDTIRVVILQARGPAFSAGHDLKELTAARAQPDRGRADFQDILARCATLMQAITHCPKPVIAQVHATATAAGCQLVASCDLAVASDQALFATPGVNIGLFCSTPMVALSRNVSRKQAMEMLLLGESIEARRAVEFGLVNKAVSPEKLDATTKQMAQQIASKSPLTVSVGKKAFYQQIEKNLQEAYSYAGEVMLENMLARDAEEGIEAFLQKRPPVWKNR